MDPFADCKKRFGIHFRSIVRKLVPPKIMRLAKDYVKLYPPKHMPRIKMTGRKIRYIIRQRKKGASPSKTATEMKITPRYERMLWARYKQTDKLPVRGISGRPKKQVTEDVAAKVLAQYKEMPAGVVRLAQRIKENDQEISYSSVYRILTAENLVTRSPAKSKKRKWVRYERKHSNSMWHADCNSLGRHA